MRATTIPIVFVIGEDSIKVGLVASLSRPTGNVTGISNFMIVLGAKRLELVSEAVPKDARLALLVNPNNPNAGPDTKDLQTAAAALGRHLEIFQASSERETEAAFAAAVERKVRSVYQHRSVLLRAARTTRCTLVQPTNLDLVINLRTAKELGLNLPNTLIGRADEIIE